MKILFGLKVPDDLTRNGFDKKGHPFGWNEEYILALRQLIRQWLKKTPEISHDKYCHSYSLKHRAERALGVYCSNGDMIAAMIAEGFSYEREGLNAWFNVSWESIRELERRYPTGFHVVGQTPESVAKISPLRPCLSIN